MPPVFISWKSPAEERAVGLSHVKLTWLATYKYSQIKMRRNGRSEAAAESGHHLGWEWLSPYASFDESTPVASSKWLVNHAFPPSKQCSSPTLTALGWGKTAMSSSLQDPTPSRVGCRPRLSWEPDFPGACLA
ncbi:unnamed protein product [Lathyrus oleraceus]